MECLILRHTIMVWKGPREDDNFLRSIFHLLSWSLDREPRQHLPTTPISPPKSKEWVSKNIVKRVVSEDSPKMPPPLYKDLTHAQLPIFASIGVNGVNESSCHVSVWMDRTSAPPPQTLQVCQFLLGNLGKCPKILHLANPLLFRKVVCWGLGGLSLVIMSCLQKWEWRGAQWSIGPSMDISEYGQPRTHVVLPRFVDDKRCRTPAATWHVIEILFYRALVTFKFYCDSQLFANFSPCIGHSKAMEVQRRRGATSRGFSVGFPEKKEPLRASMGQFSSSISKHLFFFTTKKHHVLTRSAKVILSRRFWGRKIHPDVF